MELIKMQMTPKERAIAYGRGEEVDRIPTSLSASETVPPLYGIDICDYYFSADAMVEVESRLAEEFQADNMGIGLGLRTVAEALGTEMHYSKNSVSYVVKPRLQTLKELGNMELINIEKDGRFPIIIEAFDRLQEKFGAERILGSGVSGPITTATNIFGTEKFLRATVKDKEGVHKLLQYTTDVIVKCCEDLNKRLGIKFMLSEPIVSGDLLSKRQFKEYAQPYIAQAVERMNKFQGATSIHICGKTRDRWDEIVDCGISSFWADNCESLKDLKEKYGHKIALSGNVMPVDILKNGTPDEIAANIKKCILEAADNPGGYNLCPGCTTPVGTSKENMIAFMNAAAVYGKDARKGQMPKGIQMYL